MVEEDRNVPGVRELQRRLDERLRAAGLPVITRTATADEVAEWRRRAARRRELPERDDRS